MFRFATTDIQPLGGCSPQRSWGYFMVPLFDVRREIVTRTLRAGLVPAQMVNDSSLAVSLTSKNSLRQEQSRERSERYLTNCRTSLV